MANNKKISDIFPIFSIDSSGIVLNKNADLSVIFKITYPEVFCTSENNYMTMLDSIAQAVKSLGEGYIIHKQDLFLEETYKIEQIETDIILQKNEEVFQGRTFINHLSYLIVTLPNTDPLTRDSSQASLFRKFYINSNLLKKGMTDVFLSKIRSFQSTISQSKLLTAELATKNEILGTVDKPGILQNYFSLSFTDKALSDINTEKGLKIAGKHTFTSVINSLEDQYPTAIYPVASYTPYSTDNTKMMVSMGMALGLNLQFNHIYNQIFMVVKQKELKNRLVSEIKRHNSFLSWSSDNSFAIDEKVKYNNTLTSSNGLAVKAHFNVMAFHENPQMVVHYGEQVDSAISNMGFVVKRASTYAEQLYWACIPCNASELGKDNFATCFLDNAINMYNLETNYSND